MKHLPWTWFDHRADPPRWIVAGIGQIEIEWSILERELEELVRLLFDIDIKSGRIAVHRMNARMRLLVAANMLQAHVYNGRIDSKALEDFLKLKKKIEGKIESNRNMVTHGLWDRIGRDWYVLRTNASRPVPELEPDLVELSRAVIPQKVKITRNRIAEIEGSIVKAAIAVEAICQRLEVALAPLQHKRPPYTRRRRTRRVARR